MVPSTRHLLVRGCALAVLAWTLTANQAAEPLPQIVEFNRDIRPILSDTCFQCHGPDQAKRKADLRLDLETAALADRGGHAALVPGNLAKSELFRRITVASDQKGMPPARSGKKLSERQIDLIRRWIEQGAKWQKHWSFIPPVRPAFLEVKDRRWLRTGIDSFVLARLEREGLAPSAEAERTTLLRRLTLDLTGLPPAPTEVDAFLADSALDAYEKVVDRLLSSPRYGERQAIRWLDAARYADTNGYQNDGERFMWRWRDWVIDAFNRNLPFEQFTIEQLAGDLLPAATLDQKIATGFNRNHRGNAEGGIIPEEYAVEYVVDRVETTATVWLGLTLGCARCHDHKFDPFQQKEFYQLFAFFNNVPENGRAIKYGNSPPLIKAPTRHQQEQLRELEEKLATTRIDYQLLDLKYVDERQEWESRVANGPDIDWAPAEGLVAHFALDGDTSNQCGKDKVAEFRGGSPAFVPGRIGQAGDFDGKRFIDAGNVGPFGFQDKFSLGAWIKPRGSRGGAVLSRMPEMPRADGYSLRLEDGRVQLNLVKRWLDDALRVETENRLPSDEWHHVMVTYDGSRVARGVTIYVDGKPQQLRVLLDELNQSFQTPEPFRIGSGGGPRSRFHGFVDEVRVYDRCLKAADVADLATTDSITAIARLPWKKQSPEQFHKIHRCYVESHAPKLLRESWREMIELEQRQEQLEESIPTTMVMEEMPKSRDTFVLIRGVYDKHGEKVVPGVPVSLAPFPSGRKNDRLGLARWLVDPAHPLTARVAVNRIWQMYFGTGLVKTVDDFGAQGEWPSHPDLLDWLATEFIRTGWDVKALHRQIVLSATYRQSSKITPGLVQRDPDNRLLARGPRLRLSAEIIRDQALAASGLLVESLGGPSVRPYQPGELWKELSGEGYLQDRGDNLYRRSLYTFWKRTVAPPSMMTFDAAGRETCWVRETRTNTPLQALTLMNELTFVEAARVLAQRIMVEGGPLPEERITLAFRLATGRLPRQSELQILLRSFRDNLAEYRKDPNAAAKLVSAGEAQRDDRLDISELAAYTAIAGLVLNLDETITKE